MSTELFEKYITGKMIGQDKLDFESKLTNNPALKEQYDVYLMQDSFLKNRQQKEDVKRAMGNVMADFKKEQEGENKTQTQTQDQVQTQKQDQTEAVERRGSKLIYFIPAAVAAMLLLGLFLRPLFDSTSSASGNLYANYFNPEAISLQTRSTNSATILKAEEAFNAAQYEAAFEQFSDLTKGTSGDPQMQFYKGISALGANKLTHARQTLEPLLTHSVFGAGANYYMALLMIKQNDIDKAKEMLNQIPSISSYYKKAQELVKKL